MNVKLECQSWSKISDGYVPQNFEMESRKLQMSDEKRVCGCLGYIQRMKHYQVM